MLKAVIDFELIFVMCVEFVPRLLLLFVCGCAFVPAPFVVKTISSPLHCSPSGLVDDIYVGIYFQALYSVLQIHLSCG